MSRLVPVDSAEDVLPAYRGSPVAELLSYHNLGAPLEPCETPRLLVAACMDHRVSLRIPRDFAYVLRVPGASLRGEEFAVSFAVGAGGVRALAVIAHTDCGMSGLRDREEAFVDGLARNAGWEPERAAGHFRESLAGHEIGEPVEFALAEAERMRARYPDILVAPLLYRVEDRRLYQIREADG